MKKKVSSSIYDKNYYKVHSVGFERMLAKMRPHLIIKPGLKVLDIGCGSGDMAIYLAEIGANVVGMDYSEDAIDLAKEKLSKSRKNISGSVKFFQMDATKLKLEKEGYDWAVSIDLFEHVDKKQLERIVKKITRVLKPGGKLIVHTEPNRLYLNFTHPLYIYPLSQLLIKINKLIFSKNYPGLPKDPRNKYHKEQHVNEPTYFYLKNLFKRHGYSGKIISIGLEKPILSWKDRLYNFLVLLSPFSKILPLKWFFAYDYICSMKKVK